MIKKFINGRVRKRGEKDYKIDRYYSQKKYNTVCKDSERYKEWGKGAGGGGEEEEIYPVKDNEIEV